MMTCIVYNVACVLSIGFGAYTFIIALTEDMKINVNAINDNTNIKANRSEIVEQFSDFIETHSRATQLSEFF